MARKYRPRTFAEVVGQEPVVRALSNALDNQRLHHAYLFTGTRGVGKTTLARVLAACFNCEQGITSTPCGTCSACVAIAEGRFIDLIEVDAASRTGVDDTRELLNNAQFLPGQGRYKVYLIDEVHMLTGHSFNALLKTLEEPPEHVKFLLATTEAKKIPVTVLSRCLQFNLKNMLPDAIEAQLAKVLAAESIDAEAAALAAIARAARGSMRDALSIADQAVSHAGGVVSAASVNEMLGVAGRDEVGALLDALAARDSARLLAAGDDLAGRALDLAAVLGELQRAFHDLAIAAELRTSPAPSLQRFQSAFSAEDLQLYYQIALMGGRDMEFAPDPKVGFDMTLIRMASFEPAGGDADRADARSASAVAGAPEPSAATAERPPAVAVEEPSAVAVEKPPAATQEELPKRREASPPTLSVEPVADRPPRLETADAWHDVVARTQATGVARMILDNANLIARQADRWTIRLAEDQSSLLNDARRAEIATLAAKIEGTAVDVQFEFGEPEHETPAQRNKRLEADRQAKAEAILLQDANVQALLNEFDGRLESVHLRQPLAGGQAL